MTPAEQQREKWMGRFFAARPKAERLYLDAQCFAPTYSEERQEQIAETLDGMARDYQAATGDKLEGSIEWLA